MEQILNIMKKHNGYLCIEACIVGGLVVGLGSVSIKKFQDSGIDVTQASIVSVHNVQEQYGFD